MPLVAAAAAVVPDLGEVGLARQIEFLVPSSFSSVVFRECRRSSHLRLPRIASPTKRLVEAQDCKPLLLELNVSAFEQLLLEPSRTSISHNGSITCMVCIGIGLQSYAIILSSIPPFTGPWISSYVIRVGTKTSDHLMPRNDMSQSSPELLRANTTRSVAVLSIDGDGIILSNGTSSAAPLLSSTESSWGAWVKAISKVTRTIDRDVI